MRLSGCAEAGLEEAAERGTEVRKEAADKRPTKIDTVSGGNGEGVPPVPIPNTEVKPFSADGTWLDTARESRSPPDSNGYGK